MAAGRGHLLVIGSRFYMHLEGRRVGAKKEVLVYRIDTIDAVSGIMAAQLPLTSTK